MWKLRNSVLRKLGPRKSVYELEFDMFESSNISWIRDHRKSVSSILLHFYKAATRYQDQNQALFNQYLEFGPE